mmetsp:Transcript_42658/g.102925  ORF Transcript_42658/g.102925 Transcript_42658/m.102925 type:complete len:425 (+) Transcript_42658:2-1276(+)
MARFSSAFAAAALLALILAHDGSAFSMTGFRAALRPTLRGSAESRSPIVGLKCEADAETTDTPSGLPPMPKFFSKWDDPNYDPTKDVVDTDVPLQIAAFYGDVEEMAKLVKEGADVNEPNNRGWTALMYACRYRHEEAVQWLIDNGADIKMSNSFGATALMQAAHYGGPTHLLTKHLTAEEVDFKNVFNWTAFTWAGKGGHADSARALAAAGGDVNHKNMKGSTPLIEASTGQYEKNGNQDIVPTLLELGGDVFAMSDEGDTPLHNAAYLGFTYCLDLLLKEGADPNAVNKLKESPVYNCARGGDPEALKMLLDVGGDPNIVTIDGRVALHEAARWGKVEVVNMLLEAGADVNIADKNMSTPLHESVLWGQPWDDGETTYILMQAGAKADAKNKDGKTALDLAGDDEEDECVGAIKGTWEPEAW